MHMLETDDIQHILLSRATPSRVPKLVDAATSDTYFYSAETSYVFSEREVSSLCPREAQLVNQRFLTEVVSIHRAMYQAGQDETYWRIISSLSGTSGPSFH